MHDASAPVRRLCVAVDSQDARVHDLEQFERRRDRLVQVVELACADVDVDGLFLQQLGAPSACGDDGAAAVLALPAGVDEVRVVADLPRALCAALRWHNQRHGHADQERLRLRLAFHQGITLVAEGRFTGPAVTTACRLCGCRELRAALDARRDADLAVIVSDQLFADLAAYQGQDPRLGGFERVWVRAGDVVQAAWVQVLATAVSR